MKKIFISEIQQSREFLQEIVLVYTVMKEKSQLANDLRGYMVADTMLKTLEQMVHMMELKSSRRHYYYVDQPYFYYIEDSDTISDMMTIRDSYIHHPAFA